VIEERTLGDGGQTAEAIADRLAGRLAAAQRSLEIALYDVRLPGAIGDTVAGAIRAAASRGVAVRIAFNQDGDRAVKSPARTEPSLLEQLGVPLRAIPGDPDLMHPGAHPYARYPPTRPAESPDGARPRARARRPRRGRR
jgi:phosphatidylserine/phosphatidylglycerophosphate/cardiolipin synthase-like enzyme